jgi:hypothetical protein
MPRSFEEVVLPHLDAAFRYAPGAPCGFLSPCGAKVPAHGCSRLSGTPGHTRRSPPSSGFRSDRDVAAGAGPRASGGGAGDER